jgi:hypothetical protein
MKQNRKSYGTQFGQLFLLSVVLLLSGCWLRSRLNGTYVNSNGIIGTTSLTFKSNGKVIVAFMDRELEGNYELDGNKIRITYPQRPEEGTQIMTLLEDGSIEGPGGKYTKQKK